MKPLRVLLALCALVVPLAAIAGCGGVPGGAVATVDDEPISMESFDHWMAVAARSSGSPNAHVPKPPDFAACVAHKRKPAKGQPKATDRQLKEQCRQEYESLRSQVLQLLVSIHWLREEASERGISVTDAEMKASFDQQRKQSFPKSRDYRKFLEDSGQSEQDVLLRVELDLLFSKIREQVSKRGARVTDRQAAEYYRANKSDFGEPERRDLRVVLTKTEAGAERAKAALAAGASWKEVAKKYSIDPRTRSKGGRLRDVPEGQEERALDAAVFRAAEGELTGPVKTSFGHYVFAVTKVTRGSRQTLEQATPAIKQILAADREQKALDEFLEEFREKWRARTECREGYETADCDNGPEPTPAPSQAGRTS